MRVIKATVVALGLMGVVACGSGTGSDTEPVPRGVLTSEMLLDTQEGDLFGAIQRLRPQWLRARGAARISGGDLTVSVFVDDIRRGQVDYLRTIRLESVQQVRFLSGAEATTRWGTGVSGGVILVNLTPR